MSAGGTLGDSLDDHALDVGDDVELELLVPEPFNGIRRVEGTIVAATPAVLILETRAGGHRRTRVRWSAIALIRDAYTAHPGA